MSLFKELKRRNVFRVGIAYSVAAWLLIQVTDIVFPASVYLIQQSRWSSLYSLSALFPR